MKTKKRPTVVDLFAGAGGLSLGFEQAGFDVVCAVEIDPIHAAVHEFNFPNCSVIPKSVVNITAKEILSKCQIKKSEGIDVLIGGAPCQGFSLIGQRALDDPRNGLVKEFIRLVQELKPRYFLFENVKGLTVGKHKHFLREIIEELQKTGYSLNLPWKVLNAKNFSVPQSRERLFLIGSRGKNPVPKYPVPSESIVTCTDALKDIPDAENFPELLRTDQVKFKYLKNKSQYSEKMRCEGENSWAYGYKRKWSKNYLTSSRRTKHTEISRSRFAQTEQGKIEPISRFFKLSSDGVSNTLRAGTDSSRGAFTSPRPIHYKYPRCITVREMARLHGFPDWFRFHSTKWHGARQIGNSVPPPLAFSIANEIMRVLPYSQTNPTSVLPLGNQKSLYWDMSNACRHFGIQNPISPRNRKSGTTKRKQSQITNQKTISF